MEIQGYPDYLVYNDGRVFSKKSNIFLKPQNNGIGYYQIILRKNNKVKSFRIHRLVGLHYIPKVEGKDFIDHIDGNKLNNHVNNLRWTSRIENNNNYKSIQNNNTSGFKNISPHINGFQFHKTIYGTSYQKYHKNLNELLWYKFAFLILNI